MDRVNIRNIEFSGDLKYFIMCNDYKGMFMKRFIQFIVCNKKIMGKLQNLFIYTTLSHLN